MSEQRKKKVSLIAGILLALCGLLILIPQIQSLVRFLNKAGGKLTNLPMKMVFNSLAQNVSFPDILLGVGLLFAGIVLLLNRRGLLLGIPFALCALAVLWGMIVYIPVLKKAAEHASKYGDKPSVPGFVLSNLLAMLPYALLSAGAIVGKKRIGSKFGIALACAPALHFALGLTGMKRLSLIHGNVFLTLASSLLLLFALTLAAAVVVDAEKNEKSARLHTVGGIGLIAMCVGGVFTLLISGISALIYGRVYFYNGYFVTGILWTITFLLLGLGSLVMPLTLAFPKGEKKAAAVQNGTYAVADGYISMVMHIVLLLLTGGIWTYIWIYRTTAYLNRKPNEEQYNPVNKLLLCLFVPFYSIYWFYKHGQRLDAVLRSEGKNADTANLCLILGILLPIGACILMQDKINGLCCSNGNTVESAFQNATVPQQDEKRLENLRQLKELLDSGVITQEEFDAKKKQILGL